LQIKQALQLKPGYAEAHNNLAYVLIKSGHPEEARKHLVEALRINPGYVQAQRQLNSLTQDPLMK
jgi:Flp pilus assembly protein TadD